MQIALAGGRAKRVAVVLVGLVVVVVVVIIVGVVVGVFVVVVVVGAPTMTRRRRLASELQSRGLAARGARSDASRANKVISALAARDGFASEASQTSA